MEKKKTNNRINLILQRILEIQKSFQAGLDGPVEFHELAICYYHIDNLDYSLSCLQKVLDRYPDYIEIASVSSLQALILIQTRQFEKAEKVIASRLEKTGIDLRLLSMMAYVYEKTERASQAIHTIRQILQIDPKNTNALNSLAWLLTIHGTEEEQNEAFSCLRKALKHFPANPAYLDSLGMYYAHNGDKKRARAAFMKAIEYSPWNTEILQHIREVVS